MAAGIRLSLILTALLVLTVGEAAEVRADLDEGLENKPSMTLSKLLQTSRDVPLAAAPLVERRGRAVFIAVYQNPRAGLRDLKIDAVLLARTIWQAHPDKFDSFTFHFYGVRDQAHFTEVVVPSLDLKMFAGKRLSQAELLAGIGLRVCQVEDLKVRYGDKSYGDIIGGVQVVSGIYMSERKELLARIISLRANGYDVRGAERQFLKVEDTVRNRDKAGFDLAYHQLENSIAAIVRDPGTKVRLASEEQWQR